MEGINTLSTEENNLNGKERRRDQYNINSKKWDLNREYFNRKKIKINLIWIENTIL